MIIIPTFTCCFDWNESISCAILSYVKLSEDTKGIRHINTVYINKVHFVYTGPTSVLIQRGNKLILHSLILNWMEMTSSTTYGWGLRMRLAHVSSSYSKTKVFYGIYFILDRYIERHIELLLGILGPGLGLQESMVHGLDRFQFLFMFHDQVSIGSFSIQLNIQKLDLIPQQFEMWKQRHQ